MWARIFVKTYRWSFFKIEKSTENVKAQSVLMYRNQSLHTQNLS